MFARFRIYRGKRPLEDPLPEGIRKDTRKHQNHCLSPAKEIVLEYLEDPTPHAWQKYKTAYLKILNSRLISRKVEFDKIASLSETNYYYIGCNCPLKINPNPSRCHTMLALQFMKEKYPKIEVKFPTKEQKLFWVSTLK